MTRVALQLYTIRDECARDLAGTIRRVGEIGYDGVELFPLGDAHDPEQIHALVQEAGLAVAGRHAGLDSVENELPALTAELRRYGTDHLAISWVDPDARDEGLHLGFHNHWSEVKPLAGGKTFLDLLRELPEDELWLELDLGWIWQGGSDPIGELQKTRGRCPLVHVKDYASREGRDDVPVGTGVVGYDRILPVAVESGAEWLIVEEDDVGGDPYGAIATSLEAVRRITA